MSKFDRPTAWQALEREDAAYWTRRSPEEKAAAIVSLAAELAAVARQQDPARAAAADEARRADKLRGWLALKERLGCPGVSRASSKASSDAP